GIVLYGALSAHILLALYAIYQRYILKMPMWEAARLLMGLAIPFFMLGHIMNTRFAHEVLGVEDTYVYEFVKLWPNSAVDQTVLLLLVWIHSCIGLHYWLRLKNWYRRTTSLWFTLAILIPTLSLLGFYAGGQLMERLEADAAWLAQAGCRRGGINRRREGDRKNDLFRHGRNRPLRTPVAQLYPEPERPDHHYICRRAGGQVPTGSKLVGNQPGKRYSARFRLRRPRPVLDLPRSNCLRHPFHGRAGRGGTGVVGQDQCAADRPSGLPMPAEQRRAYLKTPTESRRRGSRSAIGRCVRQRRRYEHRDPVCRYP
ncbi:MAG: hypothetical protein VW835_21040, partial [Rickettsiales bacterium]